MTFYSNSRRYKLRIYFTDSPHPVEVEGVMHMQTEGGLLRIITEDGLSQWWPLVQVFNIRQVAP
jgi:hypothetical protein